MRIVAPLIALACLTSCADGPPSPKAQTQPTLAEAKPDPEPPKPITKAKPKPPEPVKEEWRAGLGQGHTIDGAVVSIVDSNDFKTQSGHYLTIRFAITTASDTKKFNYESWRETPFVPVGGRIADNYGNTYKREPIPYPFTELQVFADQGPTRKPLPRPHEIGDGAVSPGVHRADFIFIQHPIASAEYLDLDLPGKNLGVEGTFRFRIPHTAWSKPR